MTSSLEESRYTQLDATALAAGLVDGTWNPNEVQEIFRARLKRLDAELSFLAHDFEGLALPVRPGPLSGVPFLLKDELELDGTPVTLGTRILDKHVSSVTHPFIQKLMDAGLVPAGRTVMSELGLLPTTEPLGRPPCRNPWHREFTAGGSSGGAAAAVAAGVVPFAHAADGGGSIRIPASACGLVGLKPSRGRHPLAPTDPPLGFVSHLCVSRSVRDTALCLDLVQGSTPGRYWVPPPEVPYRDIVRRSPGHLTVGVTFRGVYGEPAHPEVDAALRTAANRLSDLGHTVREVEPAFSAEELGLAFGVLWAAAAGVLVRMVSRALEKDHPRGLTRALLGRRQGLARLLNLPDLKGPRLKRFTRWLIARDDDFSPSALWLAHLVFNELGQSLGNWFASGYDLWLTPTLMRPPFRVGELDMRKHLPARFRLLGRSQRSRALKGAFLTSEIDSAIERELLGFVGFTPVANITGLPAVSLPMGTSLEGVPVGMHLLAPLGREDRLLTLANQWEEQHPWPKLAPNS
ncbi:MAG: amidase family protein [Myxococcota bacterium]